MTPEPSTTSGQGCAGNDGQQNLLHDLPGCPTVRSARPSRRDSAFQTGRQRHGTPASCTCRRLPKWSTITSFWALTGRAKNRTRPRNAATIVNLLVSNAFLIQKPPRCSSCCSREYGMRLSPCTSPNRRCACRFTYCLFANRGKTPPIVIQRAGVSTIGRAAGYRHTPARGHGITRFDAKPASG